MDVWAELHPRITRRQANKQGVPRFWAKLWKEQGKPQSLASLERDFLAMPQHYQDAFKSQVQSVGEQSAASASLTAPMSAEPAPITDGTPAAEAHPGDMSGLEPTRGSTQAMRDDMEWLGSDPGFLKDLAFDTDEAKEETHLYYDALKMLFCYLRGSWSEKTTCRLEQRLGKEFFEGQLRDVYLNSQAVAQKLNEQNPLTVKTITDMIVSTPTEELDALLQLLGGLIRVQKGALIRARGLIRARRLISAMYVVAAISFEV